MNGKIKTCYISAPSDSNLLPLRRVLSERGISVMNPEAVYSDVPVAQELTSYLDQADLVVGILSRERRSDWTLFELGAAWTIKRQILLVIPPGATLAPPAGLAGVLVVRANLSNIDAVAFAVDQLLVAPDAYSSPSSQSRTPPVGDDVNVLEIAANAAIRLGDESALLSVISNILHDAHLEGIVAESSNRNERADFAVWVDELASTIGNPLLIEVKMRLLSGSSLRDAASRLSKTVATSGTRFGLLLYAEGPAVKLINSSLPFNVLALPISELLQGLRKKSFPALVRHLRNQRVHGVDS